jgi:hypothetical protein
LDLLSAQYGDFDVADEWTPQDSNHPGDTSYLTASYPVNDSWDLVHVDQLDTAGGRRIRV